MVKKINSLFVAEGLRYGGWLIGYICFAGLLNVVLIYGNDCIAKSVDDVMAEGTISFGGTLGLLCVLIFAGCVFAYAKSICGGNYSARVQKSVRSRLINHVVELPFSYFDEKGSGSILTKLISDVGESGKFFSEILPLFLVDCITVLLISVYLVYMDPRLIVVLFASYPVMLVIADRLSKKLAAVAKRRRGRMDDRTRAAFDAIQGIEVLRSYNLYEVMSSRIGSVIDDIARQACKSTHITSAGWLIKNVLTMIPIVFCYLFALWEVLSERITTGEMFAFTVLLGRMIYPLGDVVFCVNDFREAGVALQRLEEIYASPQEEKKTDMNLQKGRTTDTSLQQADIAGQDTAITFENVNFTYEGEKEVLKGISFSVRKGEYIAFVGASGQGKTTLFRLFCGFYPITSGTYTLFGRSFDQWKLSEARNCFSLVGQNVFLYPDTIYNNVAFGRESATREEVIEACRNANIHTFITGLANGYDTYVGERGVRLSGGERQRIAIARAFLKDAPILLLDEPTSAVDTGNEREIQKAIERIAEGRTVIVIAHRLSTIQQADRILVLDQGKICESGTHAALLEQGSVYAGLYGKEQCDAQQTVYG